MRFGVWLLVGRHCFGLHLSVLSFSQLHGLLVQQPASPTVRTGTSCILRHLSLPASALPGALQRVGDVYLSETAASSSQSGLSRISRPRSATFVFNPVYRALQKALLAVSAWTYGGKPPVAFRPRQTLPEMLPQRNRRRDTCSWNTVPGNTLH